MHDLTEKEYDALDEKWTKTTPRVGPNGTGFFAQKKTIDVDAIVAEVEAAVLSGKTRRASAEEVMRTRRAAAESISALA